jgi:hypothetical protein
MGDGGYFAVVRADFRGSDVAGSCGGLGEDTGDLYRV